MASQAALDLLMRLRDEASGPMNRIKGNLVDIGKAAAGMALGMAGLESFRAITSTVTSFASESVMAAARVQELGGVLDMLGERVGYTGAEMDALTKSVKAQGIETAIAQGTLSQMARFQMDLAQATDFARMAQDAAIFSMEGSSQAMEGLMNAVITGNVRMARSHGIIVNFGKAMDDMAASLGKTAAELTENEQVTARFNAMLEAGTSVAGAYEKAMEAPGKQLRSLARHAMDVKEAIGTVFLGAFGAGIGAVTDFVKEIKVAVQEGGAMHDALVTLGEAASALATTSLPVLLEALTGIVGIAAEIAAFFANVTVAAIEERKAIDELAISAETAEEFFQGLAKSSQGSALGMTRAAETWKRAQADWRKDLTDTSELTSSSFKQMARDANAAAKEAVSALATGGSEIKRVSQEAAQKFSDAWSAGFDSVSSLMTSHYRQMQDMASSAQLEDIRAQAEYSAKRAQMVAAGMGDEVAELDRGYANQKTMRDLDRKIALIQIKAKYKAELDEQLKAFGKKMAMRVADAVAEEEMDAATASAILLGLKASLGTEVAMYAETALDIMDISKTQADGVIGNYDRLDRRIVEHLEMLKTEGKLAAELGAEQFGIDMDAIQAAIDEAYSKMSFISGKGMAEVGRTTERAAEEVTADIADTLDSLFKSIASIMETLSADLPDLPSLTVGKWLNQLKTITQQAANWMVSGAGSSLKALVDFFHKDIHPTFEKWSEVVGTLGDLLGAVQSAHEALSVKLGQLEGSVSDSLSLLLALSREAASWAKGQDDLKTFVDNFAKNLSPLFRKWADSLEPLPDLLSAAKSMMDALGGEFKDTQLSVSALFNAVLDLMWQVGDYLYSAAGGQSAWLTHMIAWFTTWVKPTLVEWAAALEPLRSLLDVVIRVNSLQATKFAEAQMSVGVLFDSIRDFMWAVGDYLYNVQTGQGEWLNHMIDWFNVWVRPMLERMAAAVEPLGKVLSTTASIFGMLATEIPDAQTSISAFFDRIGWLFRQIEAYIFSLQGKDLPLPALSAAAREWLVQMAESEQPLSQFLSLARSIFDALSEAIPDSAATLEEFFRRLSALFIVINDWVADLTEEELAIPALTEAAKVWLGQLNEAVGPLSQFLSAATGIFSSLAEEIPDAAFSMESFLTRLQELFADIEAYAFPEGVGPVFEIGEDLRDWLEQIAAAVTPLSSVVADMVQVFKDMEAPLKTFNVAKFTELATGMKDAINALVSVFADVELDTARLAVIEDSAKAVRGVLNAMDGMAIMVRDIHVPDTSKVAELVRSLVSVYATIADAPTVSADIRASYENLALVLESIKLAMLRLVEIAYGTNIEQYLEDAKHKIRLMITGLSEIDWTLPGATFGIEFREGLEEQIRAGLDAVKSMLDPGAAGSYPSQFRAFSWFATGQTIGQSLIQGIMAGVSSMTITIPVTVDFAYSGGDVGGGSLY